MNKYQEKELERQKRKRKMQIKRRLITVILIIFIITIFIKIINSNTQKEEKISEIKNTEDIETKALEIDSKINDWELILINKDNKLPENYQVDLEDLGNGHKVDTRIANSLKEMLNYARKQGLNPLIISSYREHSKQETLYNSKIKEFKNMGYSQNVAEEKASYWVAIPGTSEHEAGLALDIVATNYQKLDEEQENTPVQEWLMENCHIYGFVLRYPTEKKDITKINYEPWHYRYVGIENATFMKEKGFCLEEYIDYLKGYREV